MTHAFFKALLFLAAGSVIHGLGGEQDLRKMGGLRKSMPITFWTMTAGVVAIAGIWPLAGFFSKDAILYEAFQHGTLGKSLYFVGLVTALLTSFYMFRLFYLTFMGESRATDHSHHPHESPWSMLTPLVILAVLSVVGGLVGIERFGNFLAPVVGPVIDPALESGGKPLDIGLSVVAVAVALLGWLIARTFYGTKNDRAAKLAASAPGVYSLLSHKYWIDEIYTNTIVKPLTLASRYLLGWIGEGLIIRGSAWLLAGITTLLGEWLRRWQSGNLRSYSAWLAAGAAAILFFAVIAVGLNWVGGVDIRMVWAGR
jgi:NADH-quinone oxidoreductase subunit L